MIKHRCYPLLAKDRRDIVLGKGKNAFAVPLQDIAVSVNLGVWTWLNSETSYINYEFGIV